MLANDELAGVAPIFWTGVLAERAANDDRQVNTPHRC
jgi:hypothetical protein